MKLLIGDIRKDPKFTNVRVSILTGRGAEHDQGRQFSGNDHRGAVGRPLAAVALMAPPQGGRPAGFGDKAREGREREATRQGREFSTASATR